ncbi:aspartate aminotransferase family protein [Thiolinea disciformis]|uniref:aspartate aminotransferase family protein n=1 Tax=Thiolinea disciformis TaxID=125614 RepID=UPI00036511ED|nr:aspartate aminotransferase family protein [Thiolinea disciformis]
MPPRSYDPSKLQQLAEREAQTFSKHHPRSAQLAEEAKHYLYGGVPMHWMSDWSTPFPMFVQHARGAEFTDVDGLRYADFCLGDTGSMFGHSPEPVANVIAEYAAQGYTTMLPSEDAIAVGRELGQRFGLPYWQMATTATDANRWALRWARAVTGRKIIIVFDGCYHGTVDETMVRLQQGKTVHRKGLSGQALDLTQYMRVVEFNDLEALAHALKPNDVAAVLCEPAMTNIGMVLPDKNYHQALRRLTREQGTLLIIDETHTISTGFGGYTKAFGLEPDLFVLGKPIAGGLPCSVLGVSAEVAQRMQQLKAQQRTDPEQHAGHGHSGMGTTLSANMFTMRVMRANLEQVMTEAAYADMIPKAEYLAQGLRELISKHQLPWCITQIGARVEFQFSATAPRTGREAEAAFDDELEQCIHLYLLNRGMMITPFHNMMLACPATQTTDIDQLVTTLDAFVQELYQG